MDNLPPNSYARLGLPLPARKDQATGKMPVPLQRQNWLGPRFEPSNISSTATMANIIVAIREAENGDPTQLFRFYRDFLLGDDHIQGELAKRKLAVIGQPMTILPDDAENPDDLVAAALAIQGKKDCANWLDALGALMDSSCIWPVSMLENLFKPADPTKPVTVAAPKPKAKSGKAVPQAGQQSENTVPDRKIPFQYTFSRFEPVNPLLFCWRFAYLVGGVGMGVSSSIQLLNLTNLPQVKNADGSLASWYNIDLSEWEPFLRLWPIDDVGRIIYDATAAAKLDPTRHIVHRGHLLTQMRDNWGGPGRCLLAWQIMRILGRDWFGRFMERYGSPFPVAKTNIQDPQQVAFLRQAFESFVKIGGLVIGQDDQITLEAAAVQGGAEGYKLWLETCNNAISFAVTGIKPQDKPGGLNAGENNSQETIREDVRIFDQQRIAETLIKQPFARLLKINGCTGNIRIVWGGLSDADAATFATLIQTMGNAGYEVADDSMATVEERTGLQWTKKQAQPALNGAPAPGQPGKAPAKDDSDDDDEDHTDPKTLSARGKLITLHAGNGAHPADAIVDERLAAVTMAYKGAMAPMRAAILASSSREDLEARLKLLYADWSPARLEQELGIAMQICAAAGASHASS